MSRPSVDGLVMNLSAFTKLTMWSVLSLVLRYLAHPTEPMVQLHKASLVEPGCHSQKMFDLLELTVSKDLICE